MHRDSLSLMKLEEKIERLGTQMTKDNQSLRNLPNPVLSAVFEDQGSAV